MGRHFLLVLCVALAGCTPSATKTETKQEALKRYDLHGEILELDSKDKLATIKHSKIGDWMGAMTMAFPIKEEKEFSALQVGEKIDATVFVQGLDYWVADIHPQAAPQAK